MLSGLYLIMPDSPKGNLERLPLGEVSYVYGGFCPTP